MGGAACVGCQDGLSEWMTNASQFNREGYRAKDGALLAGAHADAFPQVIIPAENGKATPGFEGGFQSFVGKNPAMDSQAWNLIKKCPACGKPCATTMPACNACNTSLKEVEITKSPNLFVGFVFGVDKSGFPLKISMRREEENMIVFDDPLAITRAHLLAVPTDKYCPDIRSLFAAPVAGLDLLQKMDEAAWAAMKDCFLSNDAWRKKALSPGANRLSVNALRPHVVAAFNLPPSQYQLHLQYMLPPMLPQHVGVYKKGAHFVKLRHFPFAYVVKALKALIAAGVTISGATEMTAVQLVEAVQKYGVDYDKAHAADLAKLEKSNALLANFDPADFDFAIVDGTVIDKGTSKPVESKVAKDVDNADKLALQGYGRPYADGKPGGVYYKHHRANTALPLLA